jgi:ABC-type antimicrobial peptide transport system ATPase subunit
MSIRIRRIKIEINSTDGAISIEKRLNFGLDFSTMRRLVDFVGSAAMDGQRSMQKAVCQQAQ